MGVEDSVATLYSENPFFFREAKERAINLLLMAGPSTNPLDRNHKEITQRNLCNAFAEAALLGI